jgi:predicted transglutaminase-like cysteine proteinase
MPTASSKQLKELCLAGAALTALSAMAGFASAASGQVIFQAPFTPPAKEQPAVQSALQANTRSMNALRPADVMTLGEAAPAPLGFLRFCARRPDQCGLEDDANLGPAALSAGERAQALVAKYYWSVAFSAGAPSDLRLTPTSGDGRGDTVTETSSAGRYDWSAIFGPAPASATPRPPQGDAEFVASAKASQSAPTAGASGEPIQSAAAVPPAAELAQSPPVAADPPQREQPPVGINLDQIFIAPQPGSLSAPDAAGQIQPAAMPGLETEWADAPASDAAIGEPAVEPVSGLNFLTWSSKQDAQALPQDTPVLTDAVLRSGPSPGLGAAPLSDPASDVVQAPTAPLVADRGLMTMLNRVNLGVNGAIRYEPDQRQYGIDDYWTLPLEAGGTAAGDCKDYVLEKRRALIDAGISAADLSIAIVKTVWGETHAVLLVSTDRGELVLDSLSSQIRPWRKAPYQWVERQAPGEQLVWVKIVTGRSV